MTINFFKSFFLGITCSLFMSCHSYEAPSMQMPFIEIAMQSVSNHPIITIAVSIFFIKYFILNPALNYIIEHNGSVFLANILYYMGARVNAALLWKACHKNETDPALRCLRLGADPQRARPSYDGPLLPAKAFADSLRPWNYCTNALQLACGFHDEKLVKALLNAGADVNDDDFSYSRSRPSTPIGFSLEQQKLDTQIYEINDNIINTLLEHGALLGCLQAN